MMKSPLFYTGAVSFGLHLAIMTTLLSLGVAPKHKDPLPAVSYIDLRQLWIAEKPQKEMDLPPPQQSQFSPQKKRLESKPPHPPPTRPNNLNRKPLVPVPVKSPAPPPAELKPEPEQVFSESSILPSKANVAPMVAVEPPVQQEQPQPSVPSNENGRGEKSLHGETRDKAVAASTVYTMGSVLLEATPISAENPPPVYPHTAKRHGWDGEVLLLVQINKTGQVLNVQIDQSSGHNILDQAALKAVRSWHFHPARLNNQQVKTEVIVPVRFEIQ